jgi:hypothetical protein
MSVRKKDGQKEAHLFISPYIDESRSLSPTSSVKDFARNGEIAVRRHSYRGFVFVIIALPSALFLHGSKQRFPNQAPRQFVCRIKPLSAGHFISHRHLFPPSQTGKNCSHAFMFPKGREKLIRLYIMRYA